MDARREGSCVGPALTENGDSSDLHLWGFLFINKIYSASVNFTCTLALAVEVFACILYIFKLFSDRVCVCVCVGVGSRLLCSLAIR